MVNIYPCPILCYKEHVCEFIKPNMTLIREHRDSDVTEPWEGSGLVEPWVLHGTETYFLRHDQIGRSEM